jgi:hypothetical protein
MVDSSQITRRHFLMGLGALTCFGNLTALSAQAAFNFAPFSFAVVTDSNLSHGLPDNLKLLQESQLFLQDAIKTINEQKVDFVLFAGDQIEGPGKDDQYWQLFVDIMSVLNCPWYFVLGEADVTGPPAVDKMVTFGPDFKGKGLTSGKSYWSVDPAEGVHLIGLDTAKANSPTGDLSPAQLTWLKQDLAANKGKMTIVVSHHPLLAPPPYDGGPPFEEFIVSQGASAREILGASADVRLAISGHVPISKIQRERNIWYVSCPPLVTYPCEFRLFNVSPQGVTVETLGVRYEALVKKGKKVLGSSRLAFQYSNLKPESFLRLAEGSELDRQAYLPLAPGAVAQRLVKKKAKGKEKPAPDKADKGNKNNKDNKDKKATEKPASDKGGKDKLKDSEEVKSNKPVDDDIAPATDKSEPSTAPEPMKNTPDTVQNPVPEPGPDLAPVPVPSPSPSPIIPE